MAGDHRAQISENYITKLGKSSVKTHTCVTPNMALLNISRMYVMGYITDCVVLKMEQRVRFGTMGLLGLSPQ